MAMAVVVILGARRQTEVHQMGDGSLALAAAGGTHGDLCHSSSQRHGRSDEKWQTTYGFRNGILIRKTRAFGTLVLLLRGLVVPWRGVSSRCRSRSKAARTSGATLAVAVASSRRAGLCLR